MKFITKFLTLMAVSSAFAATTVNLPGASKECTAAIEAAGNECDVSGVKNNDIEGICKVFNKPNCYKFFSDGVSSIPECKDLDSLMAKQVDSMFSTVTTVYSSVCQVDEAGNFCEIAKLAQTNMNKKLSKEETTKALESSCASKKCTEAYIDIYTKALENPLITNKDEVQEYIKVLKSDSCTAKAATTASSSGNATSDASSTMKYTAAFFAMAGLLLNAMI